LVFRIAPIEKVVDHQLQNRVPQELQPLVGAGRIFTVAVEIGAMGQGVAKKDCVGEAVIDVVLEFLEHTAYCIV
jgi:hypothetical protein